MFRFTKLHWHNVLKFCKYLPKQGLGPSICRRFQNIKRHLVPGAFLLCAQPLISVDDLKPTQELQSLTHKSLIQNATALTVDAVSCLLNQTVVALIDNDKEYKQALQSLIALTEYSLTVLDNEHMQNQVWEKMIEVRGVINEKKKEKRELEMLFNYAEKMMITAAETAFISGSEFTCTTASERLHSAKIQLEKVQKETKEVEEKLQQVEVKSIHIISKHAEDEESVEKEEENKT